MKRSTDRILTSHTGALHMPPELQESIVPRHLGEPHDEAALDVQLRAAVADIVQRQAELGVDVVNDGEFSKSTWMGYVVDRMSGVERVPVDGAPMFTASKDRTEFARFYSELGDQTFYFEPPELRVLGAAITSDVVCSGPITYTGQDVLARDIDNLKAGLEGVDVEEVFLPVVGPGSVQPTSATSTTPTRRRCSRDRRCAQARVPGDRRGRVHLPDRRRVPPVGVGSPAHGGELEPRGVPAVGDPARSRR